jgi:heme-degrading monooxygenase HmoA
VVKKARIERPRRPLSLSFWRDDEAVTRWRRHQQHREAQLARRGGIFCNYRPRVAAVGRDYGIEERAEAPQVMPPRRKGD